MSSDRCKDNDEYLCYDETVCTKENPNENAMLHTWTGGYDGCCMYCYKSALGD